MPEAKIRLAPVCASTSRMFARRYSTSRPFSVMLLFEPTPTYSFRSEEHTSELQSLMRISYAVFCWQKKHSLHHRPCRSFTRYEDRHFITPNLSRTSKR